MGQLLLSVLAARHPQSQGSRVPTCPPGCLLEATVFGITPIGDPAVSPETSKVLTLGTWEHNLIWVFADGIKLR